MALGWNEIKERAVRFSKEWADTCREEADAKPFLIEFFNVFGISSRNYEPDKAVDLTYRPQPFINETKRIEFLFELYDKLYGGTVCGRGEEEEEMIMDHHNCTKED